MLAMLVMLASLAMIAAPLRAQEQQGTPVSDPRPLMAPVPFSAGERLEYQVKFGFLRVGSGSMEVTGIDTLRGRHAWHTVFQIRGGTFFYHVDDRLESWLDVERLVSLRHWQDLDEGRRERQRRFEIFPDRGFFHEAGKTEEPTVAEPLDDGAFLYFVRTIPLEVGHTYEFNRYFKPDRNPVKVIVLRRERVSVPAGDFDAIVVQPIIKTRGIFSEGGRAEIWLSDDADRIMLQMRSHLSFGSLSLALTSRRNGSAPAAGTPAAGTPAAGRTAAAIPPQ